MVTIRPWLDELRRTHIVEPISNDPRETPRVPDTRLGLPMPWIFSHVVGGGQAVFDEPCPPLSSRDRVLLYARLLQKGHIDELTHAFGLLLGDAHDLHGATVVDFGCGPFTAGLALANVAGPGAVFRYLGIDVSRSMCTLGAELAAGAKRLGGLHPEASVQFFHPDDAIDVGPPRAGWTIVVVSYLLASPTVDVAALCRQIVDVCDRIGIGPIAVLYTNSARPGARTTFPDFQRHLRDAGFVARPDDTEWLSDGGKPRHVHYALFHRLHPPPLPLSRFQP